MKFSKLLRLSQALLVLTLVGCMPYSIYGLPERPDDAKDGYVLKGADPSEVLYELYVVSCGYPQSLDTVLRNNQAKIDHHLLSHIESVKAIHYRQALIDMEECNTHADPQWEMKCLQERPSANLYFWLSSLQETLERGTSWTRTERGALLMAAKNQAEMFAGEGTWAGTFEMTLEQIGPTIKAYLSVS